MKHFFQELREDRRFLIFLLSLLAAAILAAGLMITVSKQTKSHRYEQQLQNGYGHLESQNYDQAISDFEAAYGLEQTDDAAVGLARAWFARGDAEKAIQVLTARSQLYGATEEMDQLLTDYKISLGIYPTVTIGGKEIETNTTAIFLDDVTLTQADKDAIAGFSELVTISLVNCGLTDIEFLRDCSKLMSVTLTENPISDLSPLTGKPDLRTLYLNDTAVTEFSQLHQLSTVTTLNLNGNWITDSDLAALRQAMPGCEIYAGGRFLIINITMGGVTFRSDVTELDLSGKGISDVTPLQGCTQLQSLDLSDNRISWITPMEEMTTLTKLDLSGNRISNISPLKGMTGMTELNLEGNSVTDLSPLAAMSGLSRLDMSGNPIYHGQGTLSSLTALTVLDLEDSLFQDKYLSLLPMGQLKQLNLKDNRQLTEAALLDFAAQHSGCAITHDYAPAQITLGDKQYDTARQEIDASYSSVIDLSPIGSFSNLTRLDLAGNGISDFSPLKQLTTLTSLNLQATGFSDCSVLTPLTGLTDLTLSGNPGVKDLTPLGACKQLNSLQLEDTGVTDVSPLQALPELRSLHLDRCPISDFTQFSTMTQLKSLYLVDCGLDAETLAALQQALPGCTIYAGDLVSPAP